VARPKQPDIAHERLASQQLLAPRIRTPADLVRSLGAVQAQDYYGALWAIGQRLPQATEAAIEDAIAARAIVRTWPMRGTLHFVPAADARWMVHLLAPRVLVRAAGRYRQLGLDAAAFRKSERALVRRLSGGRALTRREAYDVVEAAGVSPAGERGLHILGHLAQRGVLCLGARRDRQPTFVLLDEWVPKANTPSADEARAQLAVRYFASHGPATVRDFAWWSGLLLKEAQAALDAVRGDLRESTRDGVALWSAETRTAVRRSNPVAALLPPWDEYVVAYKDRRGVLEFGDAEGPRYAVGLSLVLLDGRVVGTWKRTLTRASVRIRIDYWTAPAAAGRRAVADAAKRYGTFLGRKVEL
jgi:hypothetical protein